MIGATLDGTTRRRIWSVPSAIDGWGERRPHPTAPVRQSWSSNLRVVVRDSLGQYPVFPGIRRRFKTLKLLEHFKRSALSKQLRAWRHMLPTQQPTHELRGGYGLNLFAQRPDRQSMNARQQSPVAPFDFVTRGVRELPAQHRTARFQTQQSLLDVCRCKTKQLAQSRFCCRTNMREPSADDKGSKHFRAARGSVFTRKVPIQNSHRGINSKTASAFSAATQ